MLKSDRGAENRGKQPGDGRGGPCGQRLGRGSVAERRSGTPDARKGWTGPAACRLLGASRTASSLHS